MKTYKKVIDMDTSPTEIFCVLLPSLASGSSYRTVQRYRNTERPAVQRCRLVNEASQLLLCHLGTLA